MREITWNPWEEWGLNCVCYTSQIDEDMINILKCIRDKKYMSAIAKELNLQEQYVEFIQCILASKNIVEYGTSPRGCWFNENPYHKEIEAIKPDAYIAEWEKYYEERWG